MKTLMNKKTIVFLALIGVSMAVLLNKSRDTHKNRINEILESKRYEVKTSKESLFGKTNEDGVRQDVAAWIRDKKLSKDIQNSLMNIALADNEVFKVYDDKDKATSVYKEQAQRTRCLFSKFKSKDRSQFMSLIGGLKGVVFNSQDRVNSYHKFNNIKNPVTISINQDNFDKICSPYFKKVTKLE